MTADLHAYSAVGLAHPAQVAYERRSHWGDFLHDFQIIPLFPQAGRAAYELSLEERGQTALTRFQKVQLTGRDLKLLRRRQWRTSGYDRVDNTTQFLCLRTFPGQQVTAVVTITYPGGYGEGMAIHAGACSFFEGKHLTARPFSDVARLPLHQIDPVVISETISDWMRT